MVKKLGPDVVSEFLSRATEAHGAGRFVEAIGYYEHVEACNPDVLAATYFRALIDLEKGHLSGALARLKRVAKTDPTSFEAQYALGYTQSELGMWRDSVCAYQQALALNPRSTSALFSLASSLETLGDMAGATELFETLADDPHEGTRLRALAWLARLQPASFSPERQAILDEAVQSPDTDVGLKISIYFILGVLLERQGAYDEAFAAFQSGNDLRRENLLADTDEPAPPSIAPPSAKIRADRPEDVARRQRDIIDRMKQVFNPDLFTRHEGQGSDRRTPIFILGMPRSGSTLIEQILSSHNRVAGMGEVPSLHQTISSQYPFHPGRDDAVDRAHFTRLAQTYLNAMRSKGWTSEPRFIDKMLSNYCHIGMIHLMFPKAVILHSMRDPVETCLGGYRILFRTGNEQSYDLADVGGQYVAYREMMDHWDQVLPGRVIPVSHEALVANPQQQIRWLVTEACGLPWADACLNFHKTERAVRTASVAQVRQPIFNTAIQRWRRYERHLAPLFDALGPYAPTL